MTASYAESRSVSDIYNTNADMLCRIAYSVLMSKDDAEDAVSDVFAIYLNKKPVFKDYEHEKAWFIRVTINHCHDLQRKRTVRSYTPLESVIDIAEENTNHSYVLSEVLALDAKYKDVILLHYFEGFDVAQTAKILHLTQSAVKMRLKRARERLREVLEYV